MVYYTDVPDVVSILLYVYVALQNEPTKSHYVLSGSSLRYDRYRGNLTAHNTVTSRMLLYIASFLCLKIISCMHVLEIPFIAMYL
jgi:hypothetical protein